MAQGATEYAKEINGGKLIPICLHLITSDFETRKSRIDYGFSSVMIDDRTSALRKISN